MEQASLIIGDGNWAVKSGSLLGYTMFNEQFYPQDITASRATTATRVDENGLIVTSSIGIARIDYSTGEAALLVEPQRTNYLSDSRIDTWVNLAGSTPTTMLGLGANTVENNSGVVSIASFAGDIRLIGNQVSLSVVSGDVVTYSFYARKENTDGNVVDFWLFGNAPNTVRFQPRFNFETNTLIQLQTPTNITNTNIRSTNVGNDIYLIEATFEATASTTLTANHITTYNIGGITTFGHPQVELGASATSPIVSTGTILTRNADVISKTGIADLIGQTEGVFYAEISGFLGDSTTRVISISNTSLGTYRNNITISLRNFTNLVRFTITANGVSIRDFSATVVQTNFNKIAVKYSQSGYSFWVNGINVASGITACNFQLLDIFRTTAADTTGHFFGNIKNIQLYKTALSDTEMTNLTTL
jgi:hypothetical protein